ncbi:MAG: glycosyltransferase family 87 protein, partial [Candidatus Omnitrophica bacterium]|nr:glycosyltransferase family 87 protein [Candidatus Omnitrophota bacterium]
MTKKIFAGFPFFLAVFIITSLAADISYYNRVIQRDSDGKNELCYSDFRVFWYASFNLHHHILLDDYYNPPRFIPLWFTSPALRKSVKPIALFNEETKYKLYDTSQEFYHYRYSPFIAFLMMPLTFRNDPGLGLAAWYLILNSLFLVTILLTASAAGASPPVIKTFLLWGIFIGTLRFYLTNIALGQTDIVIAFLCAVLTVAYSKRRDMVAGVCYALVLHFKLFFAPFFLFFIIQRRWRLTLTAVTAWLILLFIPAYWFGPKKMILFIREWFGILSFSVPSQLANPKNQSLIYRFVSAFTHDVRMVYAASFFLCRALLIMLAAGIQKYRRMTERSAGFISQCEIAALIIITLISSPLAWTAHFMPLVIPLGIVLADYFVSKDRVIALLAGGFLLAAGVINTDLTSWIPGIAEIGPGAVSIGAICLLAALIRTLRLHR